jgi:hypothetical protein
LGPRIDDLDHAKVRRLGRNTAIKGIGYCARIVRGRQATTNEIADRRGAARHQMLESPGIDCPELDVIQHRLKAVQPTIFGAIGQSGAFLGVPGGIPGYHGPMLHDALITQSTMLQQKAPAILVA